MDWKALYSMQEKLDKYIEEKHDLLDKDVFQEKYLALLVELGELANETRCFKFWSTKPRNEKSVILEEYVDGTHFILSLGIEKGYQYDGRELRLTLLNETEQFNNVFEACTVFKQDPTKENYVRLFENYLLLGELLGFTEADIQDAYLKKNEVNYARQDQGY
ncbi:dUTP diphosphatase [Virgibacillus sp. NKC19-16]|uniref:dUTP diphosphatase n=1 Tax=Virgibacillus salidurans TaxID=2831673 RepID=UPI001F25A746|nr:dUTP diphosphatase [Virgibacillus sp. NKC19-16]UJL45022.1 dUTP diphosphatase [Virgibacillus sp. NKC19-16]